VRLPFPDTDAAFDFLRAIELTDDGLSDDELDDYDSLVTRALHPTVASLGGSPPGAWEWRLTGQPIPSAGVLAMAVDPRADPAEVTRRAQANVDRRKG
jgi:hypothetical protein